MVEKRLAGFGVLLLVDFLLTAVMLATDKNLQTDFGAVAAYYSHWYGALAMGLLDLVLGLALLAAATMPAMRERSPKMVRTGVLGSLLWSVLAIVAMVGIVETWQAVGFSSMSEFEKYLFGTSAYPFVLSYIPWLYDLLLVAYVLTAIVGIVAVMGMRSWARPPAAPTGA